MAHRQNLNHSPAQVVRLVLDRILTFKDSAKVSEATHRSLSVLRLMKETPSLARCLDNPKNPVLKLKLLFCTEQQLKRQCF